VGQEVKKKQEVEMKRCEQKEREKTRWGDEGVSEESLFKAM
jgi:hypothetical protein